MRGLIDKDELLKKAVTIPGPSGKSVFSVVFTDDILNAKPIEPRKGHWITRPHVYGVTYCSECDFELKINDTNYCPNCGVKMEIEE